MSDTAEAQDVQTAPAVDPGQESKTEHVSIRDAVEKALSKVNAEPEVNQTEQAANVLRGEPEKNEPKPEPEQKAETQAKPEKPVEKTEKKEHAKAEEKPARERGEDGKFKAKDEPKPAEVQPDTEQQADKPEAPKRFNDRQAQADWANAPESVRKEVERAFTEMEQGVERYKSSAEAFEQIKPFADFAAQHGSNLPAVLSDYQNLNAMLQQNPLQLFETLAQRRGVDFKQLAAQALDMSLDDYAVEAQNQIAALQKEVQRLSSFEQQYNDKIKTDANSLIETFRAENPRFDELHADVMWILQSHPGLPDDPKERLQAAYQRAERLNPAPELSPSPAETVSDLSAQTALAEKSVTGAPSAGSDPGRRKPSKSVDDAVSNALARTGIR